MNNSTHPILVSLIRRTLTLLNIAFLSACATIPSPRNIPMDPSHLKPNHFTTFDGDNFGYSKWFPKETTEIEKVLICTHGICGFSGDFKGLAQHLHQHNAPIALYAYNTRSQGHDPIPSRRGDISNAELWYHDLKRFSSLVQQKHPQAEIIWMGESMGSMLTLNAYAYWLEQDKGKPPCDRLILSAPVIDIKSHIRPWQSTVLSLVSVILPKIRISLDTLSGGHAKEITHGVTLDQATNNPYYVDAFTLRFLTIFAKEVDKMHTSIQTIDSPIAVFHGGNDFFSGKPSVEAFLQKSSPHTPSDLYHYPNAYHLMLYDAEREKIFTDILNWLNREPTK